MVRVKRNTGRTSDARRSDSAFCLSALACRSCASLDFFASISARRLSDIQANFPQLVLQVPHVIHWHSKLVHMQCTSSVLYENDRGTECQLNKRIGRD
jgi:hypothetical protein